MKSFKIDNCLLVSANISVDKAVRYERYVLDNKANDDGSEDRLLETKVHYKSTYEAKVAQSLYSWARNLIHSVCVNTPIGFVCPKHNQEILQTKIQEVYDRFDAENKMFRFASVYANVVVTEITSDNLAGQKEIKRTLERSLESVKEALSDLDVNKVRAMLTATKNMASLFTDSEDSAFVEEFQKDVKDMCVEISKVLKEVDNNVNLAKISLESSNKLSTIKTKYVL